MWRTLPFCALLLLPSLAVRAANKPNETVIRMTVQPMAAPKPALKYQLLPELREMNPGNPIQGYLKCFMEQTHFFHDKKLAEEREKWRTMPLQALPLQQMQNYCSNRGLRDADYAARLNSPDWQILLKLKSDGVYLLLPDVQAVRNLAGALQIRFRIEIAERRFAAALVTAKTMLSLSRHLNEHPTLIADLVGIAISILALSTVDEMIQQPGCPNLFWALTDLPSPFVDIRKGLQGERLMLEVVLAELDDREPVANAKLQKMVNRIQDALNGPNELKGSVREWLEKRTENKEHVRAARERLIKALAPAGRTRFESFSPLQIVLLDEKLFCEVRNDEEMKALALPYWQARPILDSIPPLPREKITPLTALSSRLGRIKMAQARVDQRIALLRCVEALRIHAAEHDGKLPAKLDDIRLPLPVDPATGKPFSYKVEGKTVHLLGEPLPIRIRYEVTIGK